MLTVALPKGRLMKQAAELFGRAGRDISEVLGDSRRLRFDLDDAGLTVLAVKPSDVPTYVEYGVADAGVAGRDVLAEAGRDLYEMLDLGIGVCRLSVAEPVESEPDRGGALRVATKYPECARRHFLARGRPVEIIKLYGSVELAVMCGLADRIVDLVETGETLRQNHLVETDTILEVSARLVVNRASLKTRREAVDELLGQLKGVLT